MLENKIHLLDVSHVSNFVFQHAFYCHVYVLFLIKLRWPKKKNIYENMYVLTGYNPVCVHEIVNCKVIPALVYEVAV